MMTPHQVKFMLEQRLVDRARGGPPAKITGVHSITSEGRTVFVNFDIEPGDDLLFFEFELPKEASREELCRYCRWLASSGGDGETLH
jgi:hypothetical protein